jgi:spore maturation protein CgeB
LILGARRNAHSKDQIVYSENFDIITVTETWLNDTNSNKEILPCGYNIVRRDHMTEKRGGGVLMALREGYNTTQLPRKINLTSKSLLLNSKLRTQNAC